MIIAAFILPVALGFTALAVEGGLWYADQHQLRNMADTAALAAGWARKDEADELDAAVAAVEEMGYDAAIDEVFVISPPEGGAYEDDEQALEILVVRTRPVLMSAMFVDGDDMAIEARSVVRLDEAPGAPLCMLALRPTNNGYTASGGATLTLDNCGMHVNSSSSGAMTMSGGATVTADWVHVGGTITKSGGAQVYTEELETGADPLADPYSDLEFPGAGTCDYNNVHYSGSAVVTLNPGRYCNGLQASGSAKITLNPGTYIIDRGALQFSGGTTLTGTGGVTIILTGSGSQWASATFSGGSTITLNAPTTGSYAGMVLMKNRLATSGAVSLSGGSGMKLKGAIYMPTQAISYSGGTGVGTNCTQIIAWSYTMSGGSRLAGDCPDYELATAGSEDGAPGIVE
ncbi:MAG: pilus assembly protein TadG-related protein [Rhodospirillaceae bacterium]